MPTTKNGIETERSTNVLRKRETMVPPNPQCHEKPAKATEIAEHEKKCLKKNSLHVQGNTRPKSVKSSWFFFPLVMDNISEFLPALELRGLIRGSL